MSYDVQCRVLVCNVSCSVYFSDVLHELIAFLLFLARSNSILSIVEDSTCHYRMRVEMAILCTIPDFLPRKDNVRLPPF